jgi:hypothetical protein
MLIDEGHRRTRRYSDFCEEVAMTNARITAVVLLNNGRMLASFSRPTAVLPDHEERHSFLFAQAEIFLSIAKANRDLFGEVKHIKVSHASRDNWLFDTGFGTLVVGIKGTYDSVVFVDKIGRVIEQFH